jgi:hypothetical protein
MAKFLRNYFALHCRVDTKVPFFTFAKYKIYTKVKIYFAIFHKISYNLFRAILRNFARKCRKISAKLSHDLKNCQYKSTFFIYRDILWMI